MSGREPWAASGSAGLDLARHHFPPRPDGAAGHHHALAHLGDQCDAQSTDDAYLQSDLTPIAAHVSGYIREMPVQDYEHVRKGQLIAQLVDDDYQAAVAQLTAGVAAAAAQIGTIKAQRALQESNVQAAQAAISAVLASVDQNGRDLARQQKLLSTGSSSAEAGEKLQTTAAQLAAQLQQRGPEQWGRAPAAGAGCPVDTGAGGPRCPAGGAGCRADQSRLYTDTRPEDGFLGQRQLKPGQLVGVGGQITTLTPLPRIWVLANYKKPSSPI